MGLGSWLSKTFHFQQVQSCYHLIWAAMTDEGRKWLTIRLYCMDKKPSIEGSVRPAWIEKRLADWTFALETGVLPPEARADDLAFAAFVLSQTPDFETPPQWLDRLREFSKLARECEVLGQSTFHAAQLALAKG